ncbi:MAG: hypothetical protein L0Y58_04325 [Verrucomicrobia subdivision 3 bacterium]|nr:hypothetical protein [Limisphaerales bacterium]
MPENSLLNKPRRPGALRATQTSLKLQHLAIAPSAAAVRSGGFLGKLAGGFALLLGGVFGLLLSGFGVWAPHVSMGSVAGALVAGAAISWVGAVLLQTRWLAAALFSLPLALGVVFAAMSHRWWGCAGLLAAIAIPFVALGIYQFDQRKPHHNAA